MPEGENVDGGAGVGSRTPQRVRLSETDFERLDKDELWLKWRAQERYLDSLEEKLISTNPASTSKDETLEKLKAQLAEATKKSSVLAMRLVTKDQEQQDLLSQIADLKSAAVPAASSLRSHLVDPAVNYVFWSVKKEQEALKQKLEDTQNELNAWKFTPDSQRGKLLMAKCRQLLQENEELGKVISSGRLAKLEGDLALEKNFCKELKRSQRELEELLGEQDEDIEGMQSIIYLLQKEIRQLKEENKRLKSSPRDADADMEEPHAHDEEDDVSAASDVDEGVNDVREAADEGVGAVDDEVDDGDVSGEEAEPSMVNGDAADNGDEVDDEGNDSEADVETGMTQSELVSSSRDRERYNLLRTVEPNEVVSNGSGPEQVSQEAEEGPSEDASSSLSRPDDDESVSSSKRTRTSSASAVNRHRWRPSVSHEQPVSSSEVANSSLHASALPSSSVASVPAAPRANKREKSESDAASSSNAKRRRIDEDDEVEDGVSAGVSHRRRRQPEPDEGGSAGGIDGILPNGSS